MASMWIEHRIVDVKPNQLVIRESDGSRIIVLNLSRIDHLVLATALRETAPKDK